MNTEFDPGAHTITLYRDRRGEYRWRRRAANGRVISDSAEGYKRRADNEHGMKIANVDWMACDVRDLSGGPHE
ncbi:DUF1508 domain-containing protein [Rhodococcus pyridinivorans]|uniref:DUF1508 domain-containing protein n=1 Tax=Rhodococcus pyridinivorans TaxID=103816 RepID=UPI001D15051C|nr:DUF1508 domain-containing protein [Rhodococcus pyridinivorans]